jgi:phage terminase large subunit GpA-like protein
VLEFAPAFGWRQTREFTCCGRLQEPVQWDAEGRALCGDCGERAPYGGHAGFHIPKLYSLRHRLSDIVAEFVEAQHVPELMQKWTNTALAETWHQEKGTGIDASGLPARAEVYGPDDLPLAVKVVTGFCDVQDDRLEVIFIAWGVDEEAWVFLYEVIDMDPAQGRAWAELDRLILRKFHRRDGVQFRCAAFGIDTGGHHGSQVYDFCRKRRGRRIYATKGVAGKRPIWTPHPGRSKNKDPFWMIGVEAAKDAIYGRLKIEPPEDGSPKAGCIHFTVDLDADFYSQLTSERRETRLRYGQPYVLWVLPSGKRNEVLDCSSGRWRSGGRCRIAWKRRSNIRSRDRRPGRRHLA